MMIARTLAHLVGWMRRNGCDEKKIDYYMHQWEILGIAESRRAIPIPCPKCYLERNTLESALRQVGRMFDTNVPHLKCDICMEYFPESVEITESTFDEMANKGQVGPLIDQADNEDIWLTKYDGTRIQLSPDLIRHRIKSGSWS